MWREEELTPEARALVARIGKRERAEAQSPHELSQQMATILAMGTPRENETLLFSVTEDLVANLYASRQFREMRNELKPYLTSPVNLRDVTASIMVRGISSELTEGGQVYEIAQTILTERIIQHAAHDVEAKYGIPARALADSAASPNPVDAFLRRIEDASNFQYIERRADGTWRGRGLAEEAGIYNMADWPEIPEEMREREEREAEMELEEYETADDDEELAPRRHRVRQRVEGQGHDPMIDPVTRVPWANSYQLDWDDPSERSYLYG